MSFREETLEEASLIIRVDASSIRLMDDISERDRREIERNMHLDVLETSRFPEIMFATTRVDVLDRANPFWSIWMGILRCTDKPGLWSFKPRLLSMVGWCVPLGNLGFGNPISTSRLSPSAEVL